MTVVTTEKLSETVGARVVGVTVPQLLDDDDLPAWTLAQLEEHGALVFPGIDVDDATQVAFSKRLGRVETFGSGTHPEIFRVTLDPAKNPVAAYLRGTFDWHIDGCTDDIPIMATLLAAHAVARSGGETEFASTYAAYDALSDAEKDEFARSGSSTPSRPPNGGSTTIRHPSSWPCGGHARRRSTRWCGPTGRDAGRWCSAPRRRTWSAWTPIEGQALLDGLLARSTTPSASTGTTGRSATWCMWDNRGVLHRALPYDADSPRDMHRTTLHGDEPIQ